MQPRQLLNLWQLRFMFVLIIDSEFDEKKNQNEKCMSQTAAIVLK